MDPKLREIGGSYINGLTILYDLGNNFISLKKEKVLLW